MPPRRTQAERREQTRTALLDATVSALVELGFSPVEAEQRLAATDPELDPAERVREALRAA